MPSGTRGGRPSGRKRRFIYYLGTERKGPFILVAIHGPEKGSFIPVVPSEGSRAERHAGWEVERAEHDVRSSFLEELIDDLPAQVFCF